jgi:peptide deformylase
MRVLTISDPSDLSVLRSKSSDLSIDALLSSDYEALSQLMVATVTHPSQDGVGIAGPQVGINRRIVAVQRFDKEGEPFEVYPNIRIVWASDSLAVGPEGCLSVPDRRGDVLRSTEIIIEYADIHQLTLNRLRQTPHAIQDKTLSINEVDDTVPMVRDTINGFTAVIFQHETDHLDGVLYIDRL